MSLREIEDYLRLISSELSDCETSTERRDGMALLRMSPVGDPTRWVVISTPGDDWFGLRVADEFILINPTLRPDDEEIKDSLDELLLVAVGYLEGRYRRSGRVFRSLIVETPQGRVVLGRTVGTHVRALFADVVRR
ncbi:hypothetical protein ATJ88_2544 [Isoptericola jiangsuensis]|uniref:Uncharacterized protein n=1 Tax=Isoptericola jiangsuensis TaxID=548579 RepID=A0A2A9EZ63_9MICO|nr:hypothetical protein [Isoptericola jiangsuensis]PFG43831.1 hypothetical protein ATJ88_2544 [Isoptericola jiangsuensis]